ncbi:hypothetical protein [Clostridium magnum]|nr:hypothetical protein [Clostridium magnum]
MKLSKRGKTLLAVLIFLLVTEGYYNFVFSLQRDKLNDILNQKAEYDKKLQDIRSKIASKKKKEEDIKIIYAKATSMTSRLFPEIREENLIVDIDKLLTDNNLKALSIAFSDIKAVTVQKTQKETKDDKESNMKSIVDEYNGIPVKKNSDSKNNSTKNSNNNNNKDMPSVENMSVSINFIGTYKNLMEFIKSTEAYSKRIVVSNLKISQGATDQVTGTMQLELYAIPKISDEDKDFFKWEFNNAYGKVNPFDGAVEGNTILSSIEDIGKIIKEPIYDFVMSVRSVSSDLPTVMLGRAKDSTKSTYVYADNPQVESVELHLTKKDNKYYYKYKTSRDKYPAQYDGDGVEFTPKESGIDFKIYSNKRSDATDTSGVNIKIYNKTDKTVSVNIERDDDVKPRVSISGEGGNVQITRN